jgi:ubiquinone/menaquinone biosynthesis C-methylase UbiE
MSRALSFGKGADAYDSARPEYSQEALDLVTSRLGLGPDAEVLDLAAGTGKLTRPLTERFARVIAVEPDPGMRAVLRQATSCCKVLEGRAESIPLPDEAVDAIFVGQAFHWFANTDAVAEIARVLRPGGGLVLIWNTWWETQPPLPKEAEALIESVVSRPKLEPVRLASDDWRDCFRGSPFDELHKEEVESRNLDADADRLVTLFLSTSPFATLPPDERERVESELRRLVSGSYRLPVGTRLFWTRLS